MRHPFNPDELRGWMTSPLGVARQLRKQVEQERTDTALGSNATSMLDDAVKCLLVGMFAEARQLLQKTQQWLQLAIAEGEIPRMYGKYGAEAQRFDGLSLCNWLLDGVHDRPSLQEAVRFRDLFMQDFHDRTETSLILPLYIDAEAYAEAVRLYEKARGLKPPRDPQNTSREAEVCYVIAKHRLGQDYKDVDLDRLLERFLKKNVPELLGNSRRTDAARWMKIAHWRPGNDPIYTLLRCYDYLPGLKPPEYSPYRPNTPRP